MPQKHSAPFAFPVSTRTHTLPQEWDAYIKGDRPIHLRNRIATQNHGLVWWVVASFVRGGSKEDPDELFQIGYVGLLKAIALFNPEKARFSTFARTRIRSELQHAYRYNWHGITGLRGIYERLAKVKAIAHTLQSRGEAVGLETIALNLMAPERWHEAQRNAITPRAVELNEEILTDDDGGDDDGNVQGFDDLREAIALLPQREQDALIGYWFEGLTLRQVARRYGRSHSEVEAHFENAMFKLRERLDSPMTVASSEADIDTFENDSPQFAFTFELPAPYDDDLDSYGYCDWLHSDCVR